MKTMAMATRGSAYYGQRRGKASIRLFAIGFLPLLVDVTSGGIGRKPPSYLDDLDDRKPKIHVELSEIEGGGSHRQQSHRQLESDERNGYNGNQTDQEIAQFVNTTTNTTANSKTPTEAVQISRSILWVTMILGAIASLLSIISGIFVYVYRNNTLVAIGQPPFMYLIALGSALLSSELFFLFRYESNSGIDGSENSFQVDNTCLIELWLRNIGSVCLHMAIFCKMWRANKVAQFCKNQKILPKHVIAPFAVIMLTVIALTITQTILDNPHWYILNFRMPASDRNTPNSTSGEVVNIGACISRTFNPAQFYGDKTFRTYDDDSAYTWLDTVTLIIINLSLAFMLYMAWLTRKIPEEISDSRRVLQAVATGLCLTAVLSVLMCIGIYFKMYELSILAKTLNVFFAAMVYVGFLIVPKLFKVWQTQRKKRDQQSSEGHGLVFTDKTADRGATLNYNGKSGRIFVSGINPV